MDKASRIGSLGSHLKKKDLYMLTAQQKIRIVMNGVSKDELNEIKSLIEVDYDMLSTILGASRATLINKKGGELFDHITSERIVLLADVIAYGRSVFEDDDRLKSWLKKPSLALGNISPLSMMDTLYGIQEVKKELGRVEYGVF